MKAVYASKKSYFCRYDEDTGKWPLVLCVTNTMVEDHKNTLARIFRETAVRGLSLNGAMALRRFELDK